MIGPKCCRCGNASSFLSAPVKPENQNKLTYLERQAIKMANNKELRPLKLLLKVDWVCRLLPSSLASCGRIRIQGNLVTAKFIGRFKATDPGLGNASKLECMICWLCYVAISEHLSFNDS